MPRPGIAWLLEALERLTSANLLADGRRSREFAERFGFLGDRLRWIQTPPLRLSLTTFSPADAPIARRRLLDLHQHGPLRLAAAALAGGYA